MNKCKKCSHEWNQKYESIVPGTCPRCRSRLWNRADGRKSNHGAPKRWRGTDWGWEIMKVGDIKHIPCPRVKLGPESVVLSSDPKFVDKVFRSLYSYNWRKKVRIVARDSSHPAKRTGNLIFERIG